MQSHTVFLDLIRIFIIFIMGLGQSIHAGDIISFGPGLYPQPKSNSFFISPTDENSNIIGSPVVGFDGNNYLVVWRLRGVLMGTRVTPQGIVLDPSGFVINKKGRGHLDPQLAFGHGNYLVVWESIANDGSSHKIRAALVSPQAKVSSVKLTETSRNSGTVDKVIGDQAINSYGIPVFPDAPDNFNIYQEWPVRGYYKDPDVTFNGTDFVVVCSYGYWVLARLINPTTGEVRREKPIQSSAVYPWGKPITIKVAKAGGNAHWNRISSEGGKRCLVTWNFTASPGIGELWGVVVEFNGQSWTSGLPKKLAAKSMAPYGYGENASNGTGGYFIAWHDISQVDKKKVNVPDLFISTQQINSTNSLALTTKSWGTLYTKKTPTDFYPRVAYGGYNYVVLWSSGGTDLKKEWREEVMGITVLEPESPDFWEKLDSNAKEEAKKLLNCMDDFSLFGAYISPTGALIDVFAMMSTEVALPDWGLVTGKQDVAFGKDKGLLVYGWNNQNAWSKNSSRAIRGRFITKPNYVKIASPFWKLDKVLEISDLLLLNLIKDLIKTENSGADFDRATREKGTELFSPLRFEK